MIGRTLILLIVSMAIAGAVRGQTLTADLSNHVIGINTYFAGADLVLFGTTDQPGDVAVVIRGPASNVVVRRKEHIMGVWLNGSSVTFRDVPSFYAAATTRPLADIAPADTRTRYNIGIDTIKLAPTVPVGDAALDAFRAAFMKNQEADGVFRRAPARVTFIGEHLFRTDMSFPATVPTGNYSVEIVLISGGKVVAAQTTPLVVSRIGFSNGVYVFANHSAALYGGGALLFAVIAGWAAGAIFRKV